MTATTTLKARIDVQALDADLPLDQAAAALARRAPFRAPASAHGQERAPWRGELPAWLRGDLVRLSPVIGASARWSAQHWFDAIGLAFGFELNGGPELELRWARLECRASHAAESGKVPLAQFGTKNQRGLVTRLLQPVPPTTDNANVHVVRMGRDWVAMTETPHQLVLDDHTLRVKGEVQYRDRLRHHSPLAHPIVASDTLTNLASKLGPRAEVALYRHDRASRERQVLATWHTSDYPYIHAFGLTERTGIIIDHPLRLRPLELLWSNRGIIEHFHWQPQTAARLVLLDLKDGTHRAHETDPFFCFHTVHAFETPDATVLDLLAYPNASIIEQLSVPRLAAGFPNTNAQFLRLSVDRKTGKVSRRALSDVGFEFPQVDWDFAGTAEQQYVFGVKLHSHGLTVRSEIVRISTAGAEPLRFSADDYMLGEPVFVGAPGRQREGEGVLLSVGSSERGSALFVLDAATLEEVARAEFETQLPLGFHGSFASA